jgi:hypothetical protein
MGAVVVVEDGVVGDKGTGPFGPENLRRERFERHVGSRGRDGRTNTRTKTVKKRVEQDSEGKRAS